MIQTKLLVRLAEFGDTFGAREPADVPEDGGVAVDAKPGGSPLRHF